MRLGRIFYFLVRKPDIRFTKAYKAEIIPGKTQDFLVVPLFREKTHFSYIGRHRVAKDLKPFTWEICPA